LLKLIKEKEMFKKTTLCSAILALNLLCTTNLISKVYEPVSGEANNLRIQELIPEYWIEFPTIKPAIPSNYVSGELKKTGHVLWGTKEDIAVFSENGSLIKSELITLRHSPDVVQIGPTTFSGENKIESVFEQMGLTNLKMEKLSWGNYPVLAIEGIRPDGTPIHSAWIGLENGTTMFMNLYLPKKGDHSCPVWKNLLYRTRQLQEPEFFRSMGMDMKDGYTVFKAGSASLKVMVEKRISDNLLAVMIEPLSPNTTYVIKNVNEVLMATEWKNGEPCAKIYGTMTEKDGKYGTWIDESTISVLTKKVTIFSFDLDPTNHPEGVVIFKKPSIPDLTTTARKR